MSEYHNQLRNQLEALLLCAVPKPWRHVGTFAIGGLTEIIYADQTDDLLVVSSQGRGMFDCLTGEKFAREPESAFDDYDTNRMLSKGIGKYEDAWIRIGGLLGGGLPNTTNDGWGLHVAHLPWPAHFVFLTSNFHDLTDNEHITKLYTDGPCEFRATGFSHTGLTFAISTSCELAIYSRVAG